MLVAASAVAFAGFRFIDSSFAKEDRAECALWLVTAGFAFLLYVIERFVRSLPRRLIWIGLALAGASFWLGFYSEVPFQRPQSVQQPMGNVLAVAAILVAGGVVAALMDHWRNDDAAQPRDNAPT